MNEQDLKRYFKILKQVLAKPEASKDDLKFYYATEPDINEDVLKEYAEAQRKASKDPKNFVVDPDLSSRAQLEARRILQSDPVFKEQTLKILQESEAGELSKDIAEGINVVLGGVDIGNSVAQINA